MGTPQASGDVAAAGWGVGEGCLDLRGTGFPWMGLLADSLVSARQVLVPGQSCLPTWPVATAKSSRHLQRPFVPAMPLSLLCGVEGAVE